MPALKTPDSRLRRPAPMAGRARGGPVAGWQRGRLAKVAAALAASALLAVPTVAAVPAEARPGTTITCYDFGDFTQCVCVTNGKGEWC